MLITFPLTIISYVDVLALQKQEQLEVQYRHIINNAVKDGTVALKMTADYGSDHGDSVAVAIDAEEVIQSFLATYHLGFNAHSKEDKIRTDQHILGLIVVAYDGYYVYGTRKVTDATGSIIRRPILSEKKPYLFEGANHSVRLTLGDDVTVINKTTWVVESKAIDTIVDLPPEIVLGDFSEFRQRVITNVMIDSLNQTVNVHNAYATQLGMTFDFYVPLGEGSALRQSITDVGLMVFVQGHPLGRGKYLDMTSFNQGQIVSRKSVPGYQDGVGNLYYCTDSVSHVHGDPVLKTFSGAEEAASEGYWSCHHLGK